MERTAQGNRAAFGRLVERHHPLAWRVALRFTGNPEEARDLSQESFLKILEKASSYRPEGKFPAYLRTVVARTCLDSGRRKQPALDPDPGRDRASERPGPAELIDQRQRTQDLQQRILELPENQRLAILLHHFEQLRYREIGDILGIGERAVEGLLRRARQTLLGRLSGGEEEE